MKLNVSRVAPRPFWGDESLPVEITDTLSEYRILMPLAGINPRNVYILASPRSLLIEIRLKNNISHHNAGTVVTESIDRRITREFNLPVEIERNGTTVQLIEECLRITARKAQHEQRHSWSQLIHFDIGTYRASK